MKKKFVQKRLQVKDTEMKMASVDKVQFASFNDKETIFLAELFLCRSVIQHYLRYKTTTRDYVIFTTTRDYIL